MTEEKRKFAGDWYIIATDETEYWEFNNFKTVRGGDIRKYVEKILHLEAFDRRRHFHICSFTPAYEMYDLGLIAHYTDAFYDWQNENESEADHWRDNFETEMISSDGPQLWDYKDVWDVDYYIENQKKKKNKFERFFEHIGNISGKYWRDENYDSEVDAVQEWKNSGTPWD